MVQVFYQYKLYPHISILSMRNISDFQIFFLVHCFTNITFIHVISPYLFICNRHNKYMSMNAATLFLITNTRIYHQIFVEYQGVSFSYVFYYTICPNELSYNAGYDNLPNEFHYLTNHIRCRCYFYQVNNL